MRDKEEARLRRKERDKLEEQQQPESREEFGNKSVLNYEHSKGKAPPPPPSISGARRFRPATFVPDPSDRDIASQRSSSPDIMRYINPETPLYLVCTVNVRNLNYSKRLNTERSVCRTERKSVWL